MTRLCVCTILLWFAVTIVTSAGLTDGRMSAEGHQLHNGGRDEEEDPPGILFRALTDTNIFRKKMQPLTISKQSRHVQSGRDRPRTPMSTARRTISKPLLINQLRTAVTFRDNVLLIFSYLLHGRASGLTEPQYTSLRMISNVLKKRMIYMFNLLPVLGKLRNLDKGNQTKLVLTALAKNLPPYLQCTARFLVNEIQKGNLDMNALLTAPGTESYDYLADINRQMFGISKTRIAAEEMKGYDNTSMFVQATLGPVFVKILRDLEADKLSFSQEWFGLILINLPNPDMDPVLEENVRYIYEVTINNLIKPWTMEKVPDVREPYKLVYSVALHLLADDIVPKVVKDALFYIYNHLKPVWVTHANPTFNEIYDITKDDLNLGKLLAAIVPQEFSFDTVRLKNYLVTYFIENQGNKDIEQAFLGINRFTYEDPLDLLMAILTRLLRRIPPSRIEFLQPVSALLSALFVKKYVRFFTPFVPHQMDVSMLLDTLENPGFDRLLPAIHKDIRIEFFRKPYLDRVINSLIPLDKQKCLTPRQCLINTIRDVEKLRGDIPLTLLRNFQDVTYVLQQKMSEYYLLNYPQKTISVSTDSIANQENPLIVIMETNEYPSSQSNVNIPLGSSKTVYSWSIEKYAPINNREPPTIVQWQQGTLVPKETLETKEVFIQQYPSREQNVNMKPTQPTQEIKVPLKLSSTIHRESSTFVVLQKTPTKESSDNNTFDTKTPSPELTNEENVPGTESNRDHSPAEILETKVETEKVPSQEPQEVVIENYETTKISDQGVTAAHTEKPSIVDGVPQVDETVSKNTSKESTENVPENVSEQIIQVSEGHEIENGTKPAVLTTTQAIPEKHEEQTTLKVQTVSQPSIASSLVHSNPEVAINATMHPIGSSYLTSTAAPKIETPAIVVEEKSEAPFQPEINLKIVSTKQVMIEEVTPKYSPPKKQGKKPKGKKTDKTTSEIPKPIEEKDIEKEPPQGNLILPPMVQVDYPLTIYLTKNGVPIVTTDDHKNTEVPGLVLPKVTVLLKEPNTKQPLTDIDTPLEEQVLKPLAIIFGKNYVTKILGHSVNVGRYTTNIALLTEVLKRAKSKPLVMKNSKLLGLIKKYIASMEYVSPTVLLPIVLSAKNLEGEVIYLSFDPNKHRQPMVTDQLPSRNTPTIITIPMINPKKWLESINPSDPYEDLLPNFPRGTTFEILLRPLRQVFTPGKIVKIVGGSFEPLVYPNKGALLITILHKLRSVIKAQENRELKSLVDRYLKAIQLSSMNVRVPQQILSSKTIEKSGHWEPELTTLLYALPIAKSSKELALLESIKVLLSTPDLLATLGLSNPSLTTTRGEFLSKIIEAALAGKISLDTATLDSLKYYRSKIDFTETGALPIMWVWVSFYVVKTEVMLGKVIENTLQFDELSYEEKLSYNNLVAYLSENSHLLQDNKDFAFENYKTQGQFITELLKYLLRKPDVSERAKKDIENLLPRVKLTGLGAEPIPTTVQTT
ncbi:hypothetical protein KM043_016539 [Ampulex compressa]|nr:hypothetical protein KM043_016539 [Ampulex compressa]